MKAVLQAFVFPALLTVAVLFSACSNSVSSENGATGDAGSPAANNNSSSSSSSGYPKLASAVAEGEIKGLDGTVYTLNDKVGKVMLVNLWATWCGPCRSEIPALVRMQEQHGPKGFEVLGLNTDDEEVQVISDFSAELKVNYPMAYADTKLQANMLKISKFPGIPQSFLIDRNGHLRGVFRGANAADIRKMEEIVAKVVNDSAPTDTVPDAPPVNETVPIPLEEKKPADEKKPAGDGEKKRLK